MKTYRIKNEAVEKAVRGLFKTQEDLESLLSTTVEEQKFDHYDFVLIHIKANQSITERGCSVKILKSDVEEVKEVGEYNPNKWNQWPQVRPIKKGNYRIEHDENGYTYKFGFYWNGYFWEGRKGYGPICSNTFQDGFRFKPWDDEEGEE